MSVCDEVMEPAVVALTARPKSTANTHSAHLQEAAFTPEDRSLRNNLHEDNLRDEKTLAYVYGNAFTQSPADLFIPPEALEVILEAFEGPLDLLLYLIRRNNIDILDIPIADITRQYMTYMEMMKSLHLELAGEYLVMAALLGEIKSRSLLPRPHADTGEETDPRVELMRRLQEYERYKKASEDVDALPRQERDIFLAQADAPAHQTPPAFPSVTLNDLLCAFKDVMARTQLFEHHQITRERLSTRERMAHILALFTNDRFIPFDQLFPTDEGRPGVVVTFLAILALVKESLIELLQNEPNSVIYVRPRSIAADEIIWAS